MQINPKSMRTFSALWPLLILAACVGETQHSASVPFAPLRHGTTSALRAKIDFVVARTQSEWDAAWQLPATDQHGSNPGGVSAPPLVQFDEAMVLGIVFPAAPSSCTSVEIVEVSQTARRLVVEYRGHRPQRDEVCLAAFFAPYVFVTVPSSRREVTFVEVSASMTPRGQLLTVASVCSGVELPKGRPPVRSQGADPCRPQPDSRRRQLSGRPEPAALSTAGGLVRFQTYD